MIKSGITNFLLRINKEKEYVVSPISPKEYFSKYKMQKTTKAVKINIKNLDFLKSLGFWVVYKTKNLVNEHKWDDEDIEEGNLYLRHREMLKEYRACLRFGSNLGRVFKKDLMESINILAQSVEKKNPPKASKTAPAIGKKQNNKPSTIREKP